MTHGHEHVLVCSPTLVTGCHAISRLRITHSLLSGCLGRTVFSIHSHPWWQWEAHTQTPARACADPGLAALRFRALQSRFTHALADQCRPVMSGIHSIAVHACTVRLSLSRQPRFASELCVLVSRTRSQVRAAQSCALRSVPRSHVRQSSKCCSRMQCQGQPFQAATHRLGALRSRFTHALSGHWYPHLDWHPSL